MNIRFKNSSYVLHHRGGVVCRQVKPLGKVSTLSNLKEIITMGKWKNSIE